MGEMELTMAESSRRSSWPVKSVAVALGVLGLVGVTSKLGGSPAAAGLEDLMSKEQRVKIVPSYPACSAAKENCFDTGCCKTSGHKCFKTGPSKALCVEKCTPGVKGFRPANSHQVQICQFQWKRSLEPLCIASRCIPRILEVRKRATNWNCSRSRRSMVYSSSVVRSGMSSVMSQPQWETITRQSRFATPGVNGID